MNKSKRTIFGVLVLFILLSIGQIRFSIPRVEIGSAASSSPLPPYATVGAFANYTGSGGNIAFLSGVTGNISYVVTNVLSNGSMDLVVNGNLSLGTEVDIPTSQVVENFTDSIYNPKYLPAVPPQNLTAKVLNFENITWAFVANSKLSVPAGTFNATEYQGHGANDSVLDFWFDRSSGLVIQMTGAAAELQLESTNIATPLSGQSSVGVEVPIIAVFVVGWGGAGGLFLAVRRHYLKKSEANRTNQPNAGNKNLRKDSRRRNSSNNNDDNNNKQKQKGGATPGNSDR